MSSGFVSDEDVRGVVDFLASRMTGEAAFRADLQRAANRASGAEDSGSWSSRLS